jgi:VWFA-related protein
MDRQLHMVQGLTADTKLLLQAAAKIVSNKAPGPNVDPRDDPNALSANAEGMSPDRLALLQQFEHDVYSANMDTRVRETLDSLRAIARYLEGYPGRKNLLWISTSFPLSIGPDDDFGFTGMRVYKNQIEEVTKALADAKVAVYPMDPMGLKVSAASFDVSRRVGNMASPSAMGAALRHDDTTRFAEQQTMEEVAAKTGGRVCVNKNDLAECVKTAINDGTSYYELGYYPDSSDWHDEFRQITVKTKKPGIRLAYRAGYYARPEGNLQASENQSSGKPNSSKQATERVDTELQEAACNDVLISTAIIVAAQALPIDHPDYVKYMMAIDPKTMTLPQVDDGVRNLSMTVAACTFDKTGKPLQYLQHIVGAKLTEAQYAAVARHGIPHTFTVQPKAGTARVRLLVRDTFSGLMGSVEIPYGEGLRSARCRLPIHRQPPLQQDRKTTEISFASDGRGLLPWANLPATFSTHRLREMRQ